MLNNLIKEAIMQSCRDTFATIKAGVKVTDLQFKAIEIYSNEKTFEKVFDNACEIIVDAITFGEVSVSEIPTIVKKNFTMLVECV